MGLRQWLTDQFKTPETQLDELQRRGEMWSVRNTRYLPDDEATAMMLRVSCPLSESHLPDDKITSVTGSHPDDPDASVIFAVTRVAIESDDARRLLRTDALADAPKTAGGSLKLVQLVPFWGDMDRGLYDRLSRQVDENYEIDVCERREAGLQPGVQ